MSADHDPVKQSRTLDPKERAGAIAHYIYVLTAKRIGWPLRVPERWEELDDDARRFNRESAVTWAAHEDLFREWEAAVTALRDGPGLS